MDIETLYKIVIIGDEGTGKSSMMSQYISGQLKPNIPPTIGVEFAAQHITMGEKNIKLQIWDTAGKERYRSITMAHYRRARGMIVAFDITRQATFDILPKFITDAKSNADPDLSLILVGTKKDLADKRMVNVESAQEFATVNGMEYMEISTMNHEECENVFIALTKQIEANKKV